MQVKLNGKTLHKKALMAQKQLVQIFPALVRMEEPLLTLLMGNVQLTWEAARLHKIQQQELKEDLALVIAYKVTAPVTFILELTLKQHNLPMQLILMMTQKDLHIQATELVHLA
jgi:hypothetical protein